MAVIKGEEVKNPEALANPEALEDLKNRSELTNCVATKTPARWGDVASWRSLVSRATGHRPPSVALRLFAGLAVFVPVELVWVDADLFDADGPGGGGTVGRPERSPPPAATRPFSSL